MPQRYLLLHNRQKLRYRNIQRCGAHHHAAKQASEHGDERQNRQAHQQRQYARNHQHLDGIQTLHANGVHLLIGAHGANLRRKGAGGAACYQNGCQQHAKFAQKGKRHQIDGEDAGAKAAQNGGAQKGDHRAHHEIHQQHNGHGAQRGLIQIGHPRSDAPAPRAQSHACHVLQHQADKAEQRQGIPPARYGQAAQGF